MATTAVIAEILIIGLQVETWIVLVLLSAFGTEWIDLGAAGELAAVLTLLVLALAYVLGVVVDRLVDTGLEWLERRERGRRVKTLLSARLRRREEERGPITAAERRDEERRDRARISKMRIEVMYRSETLIRFLDYQRSRWRIARATVVNLVITGPAAALYLAVRTDAGWPWVIVPPACALVLVPATYFAAVRIQDAWVARLEDAHRVVTAGRDT